MRSISIDHASNPKISVTDPIPSHSATRVGRYKELSCALCRMPGCGGIDHKNQEP